MVGPEEVLAFWLDECKPADWYKSETDFDNEISSKNIDICCIQEHKACESIYSSENYNYILNDMIIRSRFRYLQEFQL